MAIILIVKMGKIIFWFLKISFLLFNLIILLVGSLFLSVSVYAYLETKSLVSVAFVITNPSIILMVLSILLVSVGLAGSIGTLRDNSIIMFFYGIFFLTIILMEAALVLYYFLAKGSLTEVLTTLIDKFIDNYREDRDLQAAIDLIQISLSCCGGSGPRNWEKNVYFNCSSRGVEACGVPSSCCKLSVRTNSQCGYDVLNTLNVQSQVRLNTNVNTKGCINQLYGIFETNYYILYGGGGILLFEVALLVYTLFLILITKKENRDCKEKKRKINSVQPRIINP